MEESRLVEAFIIIFDSFLVSLFDIHALNNGGIELNDFVEG